MGDVLLLNADIFVRVADLHDAMSLRRFVRQGVVGIVRTMVAEQGIRSLWAGVRCHDVFTLVFFPPSGFRLSIAFLTTKNLCVTDVV